MKRIKNKLVLHLIKNDLLFLNSYKHENMLLLSCYSVLKSLKQFINTVKRNRNIPLFIVCKNKQQNLFIINFLHNNLGKKIFLISLKTALTIKVPGVFILFDVNEIFLKKLLQYNISSYIFVINKDVFFNSTEYYYIPLDLKNLKHLVFFITLLNKIVF